MASIPLPALHVNPPPDPMEGLSRLLMMKQALAMQPGQLQLQQQQVQSGAADVQLKQQALADEKARTSAMQEWDGKDINALPGLVLKHGGSATAVMSMKTGIIKQQQDMANLTKDQLANEKTKNDYFVQALDNMKGLPPEQQPAAFEAAKADAIQKGHLDPQQAQGMQYQNPQQLDLLEKSMMGHSQVVENALKAAETSEKKYKVVNGTLMDVSGPQPVPATGQNMQPQDWMKLVDGVVPATGSQASLNARTKQQVGFYVQNGNLEAAQKAITEAGQQVGAVEKETNPLVQAGKVQVATAEGQARANIEAAMARGSNAALASVPPHLIPHATADATKAGEDYAAAQAVTQRMQATMDAARKGNVVAYQIIPEEGTLQITTSQGVHRINRTEIEQYAGGGSLWQRLQGHFGKALTGESIPPSVLDDMAQIQKIQAEGSRAKYENSLKTINQNYGARFKPVDMGATSGATPDTHTFSLSAWKKANPKGNPDQAAAAAKAQGYTVVQ